MNWGGIRPGLAALVKNLTGVDDSVAIQWRGVAASGGWRRGPRITMSIRSIRGLGRDEVRLSGAGDPNEMAAITCGNRQFTWSLSFEAESPDDALVAFEYADRFRTGLRSNFAKDSMRTLQLSLSEIEATQVVESNSQATSYSSAVVDVQMNGVDNLEDETEGAADYIAAASYKSETLVDQADQPTHQIEETVP